MRRHNALFFLLVFTYPLFVVQAQSEFDTIKSNQLFRDGVVRFHEAQYGEAVFHFQEALGVRPLDRLTQSWLGRAYFHAGFEEAALREWELLARQGGAGPALSSFIEYLRGRQGLGFAMNEDQTFFPVYEIRNTTPVPVIRRPSSVLPLPEGKSLIASFATNSIAIVDVNGKVLQSLRGGFTRLEGPFDMALVQGSRLFVTQFLGNQVFEMDLSGQVKSRFGSKGIGLGNMIGPQYITSDNRDFLYISDIGNRRIHKFDLNGLPVLFFGDPVAGFDGLERPTGLLHHKGMLYVLDARKKQAPRLLIFDESGNLLDSISDPLLDQAESLSLFTDSMLVISSGKRLLYFDMQSQTIKIAHESTRYPTRYTKASRDANGNILAGDFDGDVVEILTRLSGAYSGLHVQIQRVWTRNFPELRVEIQVSDNTGKPVVGLDRGNFSLSENQQVIDGFRLVAAGHRETQLETMLLLESGLAMSDPALVEASRNAVRDIFSELGNSAKTGLTSTGMVPVLEAPLGSTARKVQDALAQVPYDLSWSFDRGLRLAVPELVKAPGLKNVVFLGTGRLPDTAFDAFGIQETLSYLRNNLIRFSIVVLGDGPIDPALEYLQVQSGGVLRRLYQPEGLAGFRQQLLAAKDGSYAFTYRTRFDSDFGRKYLPIEVEVRMFQKSGRDESGFFAPLRL